MQAGFSSHPEGAVGHVDLSPGDDEGVFDGLGWGVHTQVGPIASVCDLNVDAAAFSILSRSKSTSTLHDRASRAKHSSQGSSPNLSVNAEVTFSCHADVHGELGGLIHNHAGGLQAGTEGFHLRQDLR